MTDADTVTLTPQWKRQLSDTDNGNMLPTATGKLNLAKYRYSREEMLAFFDPQSDPPEYLKKFPEILTMNAVQPYNMKGFTEEEQQVISQGVNSAVVTRVLSSRGRGEMRGDRGRGRGVRRGGVSTGYVYLGGDDYEEKEFDRPRGRGRGNYESARGGHRGRAGYHSSVPSGEVAEHQPHFATDPDSGGGEWRRTTRTRQTSNSEEDTNWRRRDKGVHAEHRGGVGAGGGGGPTGVTAGAGGYRGSWRQRDNSGTNKQQPPFYSYRGNTNQSRGRHHDEFHQEPDQSNHLASSRGGHVLDYSNRNKRGSENLEDIWQEDWDSEFNQAYVEEDFPNFSDLGEESRELFSRTNSHPQESNANNPNSIYENKAPQRPAGFNEPLRKDEMSQKKWTYKDPQGNIQGPFSDREMYDWYSAGFFQDNLMVKREIDENYSALGDYTQYFRRLPFTPGPTIPPLAAGAIPPSPNVATVPVLPSPGAMPSSDTQSTHPVVSPQMLPHLFPPSGDPSQLHILQQQELLTRLLSQTTSPQDQANLLNSLMAVQQAVAQTSIPFVTPSVSHDMSSHPGFVLPPSSDSGSDQKPPGSSIWDIRKKEAQLEDDKRRKEEDLRRKEADIEAERQKLEELKMDFERQKAADERQRREKFEEEDRRRRERAIEEERQLQEKARQLHLEEEERYRRQQELLMQQQEAERKKQLELIRHQQESDRVRHEELIRKQEAAYHQVQAHQVTKVDPPPVSESDVTQQRPHVSYSESIKMKQEQLEHQTDPEKKRQEQMRHQDQLEKEREEKYQKELERSVAEDVVRRRKLKDCEGDERSMLTTQQKTKMTKKEREELDRQRLYNDAFKKKQAEELERRKLAERMYEDTDLPYSDDVEMSVQQAVDLAAAQKVDRERQEMERKREEERLSRLQLPQSARWGKETHNTNTANVSLAEIQRSEKNREQNEYSNQRSKTSVPVAAAPTFRSEPAPVVPVISAWGQPLAKQKTLAEIQAEEEELVKQNRQSSSISGGLTKSHHHGAAAESSQWSNKVKANSNPISIPSNNFPQSSPKPTSPAIGASIWDMSKPSALPAPVVPQTKTQPPPQQKQKHKKESSKSGPIEIKSQVDELTLWCEKALEGQTKQLDVDLPTLVEILKDIDCPNEVEDYIKSYFGQNPRLTQFTKDFLQKRREFRNCEPPAVSQTKSRPTISTNNNHGHNKGQTDQWQTQPKSATNKKNKKKKMQQVNTKLLGFTCTSDPNRSNYGEIERPN